MNRYRVDLHVHTVLSPCGSLEMSPMNIVDSALNAHLDIIAITDHNSTKQARIVRDLALKKGLTVFCGAEVNTLEEVHCLAIFEFDEQLNFFQQFLDEHLIAVHNKPEYFGYQVVVNEEEEILEEEDRLLINALNIGILEIEKYVHQLNGLFIPAHIDRPYNGIISQLGFIPSELNCDALGLSIHAKIDDWIQNPKLPLEVTLIRNSDAHSPEQLGSSFTEIQMEAPTFNELKLALANQSGRVVIQLYKP